MCLANAAAQESEKAKESILLQSWNTELELLFENEEEPIPSQLFRTLDVLVTTTKQVWIPESNSDQVFQLDISTGLWRAFGSDTTPDKVEEIIEDKNGHIWICGGNGVSRFNLLDDSWTHFPDSLYPTNNATSVKVDTEGQIWFSTDNEVSSYDSITKDWHTHIPSYNFNWTPFGITVSKNGKIWVGTWETGLYKFDPDINKWDTFTVPNEANPSRVAALVEDGDGIIWVNSQNGVYAFDPENESWRTPRQDGEYLDMWKNFFVAGDGSIWSGTTEGGILRYNSILDRWDGIVPPRFYGSFTHGAIDPITESTMWFGFEPEWLGTAAIEPAGLVRLHWNDLHVPSRPIEYGTGQLEPRFVALSEGANTPRAVWTNIAGYLLHTTSTKIDSIALEHSDLRVNALESAPDSHAWVGLELQGVALCSTDGCGQRITDRNGLPDPRVLSISQIPDSPLPQAWVGTDHGAAFIENGNILKTLTDTSGITPGPVDLIHSTADGGAYLVFNSIEDRYFYNEDAKGSRGPTHIIQISPDGSPGTRIEVPRGDVLSLALDPNEVLHVGTSAGLYILIGDSLRAADSDGLLQPFPIEHMDIDPNGTIWMTSPGQEESPATVVGYSPAPESFPDRVAAFLTGRPKAASIQVFGPEEGVPDSLRLDGLMMAPSGDLMILAGNSLVAGPAFVTRTSTTGVLFVAFILFATAIGLGLVLIRQRVHAIEQEKARYKPLLDEATEFFDAVGQSPHVTSHRTLQLAANGAREAATAHCVLGSLLPVDRVQDTFKELPSAKENESRLAYMVHERELDPAAAFQLDVYRLREDTTIIPLPVPFLRSKTAEGSSTARTALDGLRRRYIGDQDLFDLRNAIDESRFFFGRKALLNETFDGLKRGEHVALVGQRKSGKSSVLNLLQQKLADFPVIKIDLQYYHREHTPDWPERLFKEIINRYDSWGKSIYKDKWSLFDLPDRPLSGSELQEALAKRREVQLSLGNEQPIVVLLDEMERVFPRLDTPNVDHIQRFIYAAGVLRSLGQQSGERYLSLVVADLRLTFNQLNDFNVKGTDTNPFYRFFLERHLAPLTSQENNEMLTNIGHAMGLTLEEEVKQRVYDDSGGQPALARQLASAACRFREGKELIVTTAYEKGIAWLDNERTDLDTYFSENLWGLAKLAERKVLSLAATESGIEDSDELLSGMDDYTSDNLNTKSLKEARKILLATGLLERVSDSRLRVRGALFRRWLLESSSVS